MTARRNSARTQIPSSAAVWFAPCPRSLGLSWHTLGYPSSASVPRTPRLLNGITASVHIYGAGVYFESYCGHGGFGDSVWP
jgi:hypothetical protein